MPEPVSISLSVYQQARFQAMKAEAQKITDRQNESVTTIIADTHDPQSFQGWSIALNDTEIVCTPPPAPPASE